MTEPLEPDCEHLLTREEEDHRTGQVFVVCEDCDADWPRPNRQRWREEP